MGSSTRRLTLTGLFAALVTLGTLFLKIPGPTGYYHLGDSMIYAAAVLFGPVAGGIAGAVGSALADVLGGWAIWAPWTFIIKGLTGYLIGLLATGDTWKRDLPAMVLGGLVTVVGYGIASAIMYSPAAALTETYGNLGQVTSGIIIALVVISILRKSMNQIIKSR